MNFSVVEAKLLLGRPDARLMVKLRVETYASELASKHVEATVDVREQAG